MTVKVKGPRVLYWDIETSLMPVAIFQLNHNDYIDPSAILEDRYVIAACWKWEGEKEVHSVSVLDDPKRYKKNPHDDRYVIETLHKVLSEADVIIHHNGDSFDKRYVDTRILKLNLSPLPPITSIDTYKIAKQRFLFASNKLNYLGTFLGLGEKIHTTPGLWMRVMKGDKAAVKEMTVYCKQDVSLLEKIFLKLRPYCSSHVNRALFGGVGCPRCGSEHVQSRGTHKAITRTYKRLQCQNCGGWFKLLKPDSVAVTTRVL